MNNIEDKEQILTQLQDLIQQTYTVENEYKVLNNSYTHMRETFERLVNFTPNALWVLEEDGTIYHQNSKAEELGRLLENLDLNLLEGDVVVDERSYLIKSSRYNDKILLSATENTEEKRRERLVSMGQMAAHLSHEIRNPVGSISLLASTLIKRVKPENVAIVLEMKKAIMRIDGIIKSTLLFSKGVTIQRETFNLLDLKDELEDTITYYSYSSEIIFELDFPDVEVNGDRELLGMMFGNLIFNAIDAIEESEEESGRVWLRVENRDREFAFKIYDDGVDIVDSQGIFEAFVSTKERGNGLGLVLSRQIAEAHDGDINLLNERDKGFKIDLYL